MQNRWSESDASEFVEKYGAKWGDLLALRTYSSRLVGAEESLVLHGGGNTSVKDTVTDVTGREVPAVFVKASGYDLAVIEPWGHVAIRLDDLLPLAGLAELSDELAVNEIRTKLFDANAPAPSIEALMHALLPPPYVDHTHATAILVLTNQREGRRLVEEALGDDVLVTDYVKPGFELAKAVAEAFRSSPKRIGMVLMKHGLITWGESARESYDRTIDIVTRAEEYLATAVTRPFGVTADTSVEQALERYLDIAPILRGRLAAVTGNPDWRYDRFVLRPLVTQEVLDFVNTDGAREVALSPPLTADHLIRTKALPLWVEEPADDDPERTSDQISKAVDDYRARYEAYCDRHASRMPEGLVRFDSTPRVVLMRGVGAVCAGRDVREADLIRDITAQTLGAKAKVAVMGEYEGLSEEHVFDMEYFGPQHAKLDRTGGPRLGRSVALVTGAAGAVGAGICEALLQAGAHVAVSDLPGDRLTSLVDKFEETYGARVTAVALDVTAPASVAAGFDRVIETWGGIDLVILNAGLAHVSSLTAMDLAAFRRLERVNVEGSLNTLTESARRFGAQGTGGDIILISTKNVFSPGADFGAYSATKAAAHQLARLASVELADADIRVNMVSPDAVFSHGEVRSGLWAEVGPHRMRARGLDEKDLEEYYQNRNLLKARVTATHVARAVLFFATRQTPTTGATIPVDGGLPDATPR